VLELAASLRRGAIGLFLVALGASHLAAGATGAWSPLALSGHADVLLVGAAPGFAVAGLGLLGIAPLRRYVRLAARLAALASSLVALVLALPVVALVVWLALDAAAVLFVAWSVSEVRAARAA
jgi:hypothetical protein